MSTPGTGITNKTANSGMYNGSGGDKNKPAPVQKKGPLSKSVSQQDKKPEEGKNEFSTGTDAFVLEGKNIKMTKKVEVD